MKQAIRVPSATSLEPARHAIGESGFAARVDLEHASAAHEAEAAAQHVS